MGDWFYYLGIFFIINGIIFIFNKKEKDKMQQMREDADTAVSEGISQLDPNKGIDFAKKTLKDSWLRSLIGIAFSIWEIFGFFYTKQWGLFLFSIIVGTSLSYLPHFTKIKEKRREIDMVGSIVNIIVIGLILYNHFYGRV